MPLSLLHLVQCAAQASYFSSDEERLIHQSIRNGTTADLLRSSNIRAGIDNYLASEQARSELQTELEAYRTLVATSFERTATYFPALFRPSARVLSDPGSPVQTILPMLDADDVTPASHSNEVLEQPVAALTESCFQMDGALETVIYNTGVGLLNEREAAQAYASEGLVTAQAFAQMDVITKALLEAPDLLEKVIAVTKAVADQRVTDRQLLAMVKTHFSKTDSRLPWYLNVGIGLSHVAFVPSEILAGILRAGVKFMSQRFIIGEAYTTFRPRLLGMAKQNRRVIGDILGEAIVSDEQGVAVTQAYLNLLDRLIADVTFRHVSTQTRERRREKFIATPFPVAEQPDAQIALKLSSLTTLFDPLEPEASRQAVKARLRLILDKLVLAKEKNIPIGLTIDLEEFRLRDFTYELVKELLIEPQYQSLIHVGVVVQAYHRDSLNVLQDLAAWSQQRGQSILIRLVKGAYHHLEMEEAQLYGYESPVFTEKWMSDFHYERCLDFLMTQYPYLRTAVASHNLRTQAYAMVLSERKKIPIEAQMLFGLEDRSKGALARRVPLSVYTPIGDPMTGAAYLTRRMKETGAADGYLAQLASGKVSKSHLLQNPIMAGGRDAHFKYLEQKNKFPNCLQALSRRQVLKTRS